MTRVYKVGFTGSREGMTIAQERLLLDVLRRLPAYELHHGCCVGSDHRAAQLAVDCGVRLIEHPPLKEEWLANGLPAAVEVHEPKDYIQRNHDIVEATEVLIATPKEMSEPKKKRGGGTWSTIRYALKHRNDDETKSKAVIILYPNGAMQSYP